MVCALSRLAAKAAAIFQRAAAWLDEVAAPASFKQRTRAMMCYQFTYTQTVQRLAFQPGFEYLT